MRVYVVPVNTVLYTLVFFFIFSKKLPIVVRDVCQAVRRSVRRAVCPSCRLSVRRSSVEITSFRGNLISDRPIDLKIGLNVGYGVVHVRRRNFSKFELQVANLCNLRVFANKFVCTVLTDRSTDPVLLKIDIHVRFTKMHVCNNRYFQNYYW